MDIAAAYPAFAHWMWNAEDVVKLDFAALAEAGDLPLASDLYVSLVVAAGLTIAQRVIFALVFTPLFKMLLGLKVCLHAWLASHSHPDRLNIHLT
jgi:hypothetical protein